MKNNLEISADKKYQWNQNFRNPIAHSDINLVVSELETIKDTLGSITPASVLESSRNKKSVLHGYFDWDNDRAAHSWRLRQAAELLTRIEVRVIKDGRPQILKAYEIVRRATEQGQSPYKKTGTLTEDDFAFIKKYIIADLNKVRNRLINNEDFKKAYEYIGLAIEELSKESTETKQEVKPGLAAVA